MTTNPNTPLTGQTPQSGDPPGQTPTTQNPPGQTPPPSQSQTTPASGQFQQQTPITSLPADIQDYIKRLRDEAEEANKLRKAEAKAKQEAEAARLKEQGEFKALAEQHEARVKELEPIAESYTRLASTMNANIEAEIKDWPPEVKSLVPGADVPVESRLEHMNRLRPLLEKLQVQARGTQPGNSPNPRPSGQTPDNVRDEYEKRLRATAKYGA
jgi:phage host-nuclease inhibitor protein Gam